MVSWIALICLIMAVILLVILSVIDLRVLLLPNKLVLTFALLAPVFHACTEQQFLSWTDMVAGGLTGFFILFSIRAIANKFYGQDSLGLGDVKLLGAAGLWLGVDGVLIAMTAGALAAALHGLLYALYDSLKNKAKPDFAKLQVPAGPGFAVGIIISAFMLFHDFRIGF